MSHCLRWLLVHGVLFCARQLPLQRIGHLLILKIRKEKKNEREGKNAFLSPVGKKEAAELPGKQEQS